MTKAASGILQRMWKLHFKDLLSAGETSIFKKKDGRDGVLQEQQQLRSADCNVLLTADETDKCQACKNCNHYIRTVSLRKRNTNNNPSTSTRYEYRSKEELVVTARASSKTIKSLKGKIDHVQEKLNELDVGPKSDQDLKFIFNELYLAKNKEISVYVSGRIVNVSPNLKTWKCCISTVKNT